MITVIIRMEIKLVFIVSAMKAKLYYRRQYDEAWVLFIVSAMEGEIRIVNSIMMVKASFVVTMMKEKLHRHYHCDKREGVSSL